MNLLCWIPSEHDATSFYRALQPISQLRKIVPSLHIFHVPREINMIHLAHMDVLFLQRPCSVEHLTVMKMCKNLGVKIWVDYDDNLLCIPPSNPAWISIDAKAQGYVKEILSLADIVSVSTEELGRAYEADYVIPNALNDYLFKEKREYKSHNVVFWRGSQSHQQDLHEFSAEIIRAAHKNPHWLYTFMGYNPFFITEKLPKQANHTPGLELFQYHEMIRRIYPGLFIVTLTDNAFNRCKSNIAWIEATYAGSICLAPNFEPWQKPGVITYNSIEEFGSILSQLTTLDCISEGPRIHALSWEYIQEYLRLSRVNRLRAELLEEVMSRV